MRLSNIELAKEIATNYRADPEQLDVIYSRLPFHNHINGIILGYAYVTYSSGSQNEDREGLRGTAKNIIGKIQEIGLNRGKVIRDMEQTGSERLIQLIINDIIRYHTMIRVATEDEEIA